MKRILTLFLAAAMLASLFAGCGKQEEEKLANVKFDSFAIGYAKADITPDPTSQVMLAGNNDHTTRLSTSVQEPLWANCIAFTDTDGQTVILFGMDIHGTAENITDAVRAAVEEQTGIPGIQIQMTASHTHSAPCTGYSAIPAVRKSDENIIAKCTEIAIAALESRKPAKMYTTFLRTENLNFLRHYLKRDGTYVGQGAGDIPDEQLLGHMEAADNLMQLVKFTREGEKDVVLINYQGHPISPTKDEYYTAISSQNVGVMRRVLLEKADTESLYILGGSGNVVSSSAIASEIRYAGYEEHGTALAEAAIAAFDTFQEAETGKIYFANEALDVAGRKFQLGAWGFGDLGFVTEPFESFQKNAMAVRENSPYYMTIYASIANGNPSAGYLPDAKALTYDIYETAAMFTPAGTAEVVEETLLQLLEKLFRESGQTQKEKAEGYVMDHTPKPDGNTYEITAQSVATPAENQHYQVKLSLKGGLTTLLVQDKALAEEILQKTTVKLLFDERNIAVAIDK